MAPLELRCGPQPLVIGRNERCALLLPADADKVSRQHARFSSLAGRWSLADLKSRWGTFLNGKRLVPGEPLQLVEGDLIRITPWTFSFSATPTRKGLDPINDTDSSSSMVRMYGQTDSGPLAEELLGLLLECATNIHAAQDDTALWTVILEAAGKGTGLSNASVLRPLDARGRVQIAAAKRAPGQEEAGGAYSRSLIAAASTGMVAEFSQLAGGAASESIAEMHVSTAICVPLMLGSTVAAYLYLDSRVNSRLPGAGSLGTNARAFCVALGRMASLALANLKRGEMERRQAAMDAELSAGAEAQRWILPPREAQMGAFAYVGESRPGRYVGGDFFDVLPLDDHRLVVALGDVAGKGIPASVLMTASQGFLHAALQQTRDVAQAVTALNDFVAPRCPANRFLTLWVGLLDAAAGTLTYIDAGHGYALLAHDGQPFVTLRGGGDHGDGNLPIGVEQNATYHAVTVPLRPTARLLVVSDGLIEQPSGLAPEQTQFEIAGVVGALSATAALSPPPGTPAKDEIATLFDAIYRHANSTDLADDATAVLVRFLGQP